MTAQKRFVKSKESLTALMTRYYSENHALAIAGKFVAWIAIIVPVEILKGFDIVVAVPENHAAMCAARGVGASQAERAERLGYSMDLCSYARIDLGTAFANGEGSPSMGLPRPNLVISNTNNCSLLVKWFDIYRREFAIPHFVLDVPFCYEPQRETDREYIIDQFGDLIRFLEKITGQSFDIEKVEEAVRHTDEANAHWKRFLSHAARHPSGITVFDTFIHMAPFITSFRGTPELSRHMKLLADEAEELAENNIVPVPGEKYRLLWDNIAPWHQLRAMSTRLRDLSATICSASYTSCVGTVEGELDCYRYDGGDPLSYLARIQNFSVCPYGMDLRFKVMGETIERLKIDGVVFSSNRSCKPYSLMQMDLERSVKEKYGIPTIMIDVDHADSRKYNESNVFLKLEALIEEIEAGRRA